MAWRKTGKKALRGLPGNGRLRGAPLGPGVRTAASVGWDEPKAKSTIQRQQAPAAKWWVSLRLTHPTRHIARHASERRRR